MAPKKWNPYQRKNTQETETSETAILIESAMDDIVARNKKDFNKIDLQVLTAEEYLNR